MRRRSAGADPRTAWVRRVELNKENLYALTFSADEKLAANQVMNNLREQKRSIQVWRVAD